LTDTEKRIDIQLGTLSKIPQHTISIYEKSILDNMKILKKADQKVSEDLLNEDKKKKILEKTTNIRKGRPIMTRSMINKQEKVEVKDDVIDQEE